MKGTESMSEMLRSRRLATGLSLSDLAGRSGTSVATLSRYENGWNRFEVYTLRKLATALGCELHVELRPVGKLARNGGRMAAVKRLGRLFWDHDLIPGDLETHRVWVVERVLEFGTLDDVARLVGIVGRDDFIRSVADAAARLSPRTRTFWVQILEKEGIACTKRYFRNTAWVS